MPAYHESKMMGLAVHGPGIDSIMDDLHRRDTDPEQGIYGDPSAKIWGIYLPQAKMVAKEYSDRWTANIRWAVVCASKFANHDCRDCTQLEPPVRHRPFLGDGGGLHPLTPPISCSLKCDTLPGVVEYYRTTFLPTHRFYRARIHTFFTSGAGKFALGLAVNMLPAPLHASIVLFPIGLVDFLLAVNQTIAYCMLVLVSLGTLIYFMLAIMPLFYPDSPSKPRSRRSCGFSGKSQRWSSFGYADDPMP
ncbi:hypothetical protein BJV78DRAFT_1328716 [Lactifluus subvellereus]|nr:hypothetical protein BJV78DRAFT_1328716 [Lactifluus subvellereus]